MTNMQLLDAIGMLDEKTILDAEQPIAKVLPAPRQRLTRQITAIAACALLLFGGAFAAQMGGWSAKGESAADPGAPNDGSPTYAAAGTTTAEATKGGAMAGDMNTPTAATTAEVYYGTTTTAATYTTRADYSDTTAPRTTTTAPRTTTTAGDPTADPEKPEYTRTTTAWTGSAVPTTTVPPYHTTKPIDPGVITTETVFSTTGQPEAGPPAWPVYAADLNGIPDTEDSAQALRAVGLQRLNAENGSIFAVRDGRLYFKQASGESLLAVSALDEAYMESAVDTGYTLQYDLEYTAAQADAFAAIITQMKTDGQSYRQFALRAGGGTEYATVYGGVHTPLYTAEKNALISKLPGVSENVMNVRLTVRVEWHPDEGYTAYVKIMDMIGFAEVFSTLGGAHTDRDGYAVGLLFGGAVEGYLDNIRIWLGWADEPSTAGIHYVPYTKAP